MQGDMETGVRAFMTAGAVQRTGFFAEPPATKASGHRAAASHAGRPGILLAAALALEPAAGFPILKREASPTGPGSPGAIIG